MDNVDITLGDFVELLKLHPELNMPLQNIALKRMLDELTVKTNGDMSKKNKKEAESVS